ncbi:hypothetical protein BDZ91DRAFT_784744 [Kalaharituber pfeilii]|nr:hypothetical protein BDZ91DRAFT_784744 [Kalaharituber pfeilii]
MADARCRDGGAGGQPHAEGESRDGAGTELKQSSEGWEGRRMGLPEAHVRGGGERERARCGGGAAARAARTHAPRATLWALAGNPSAQGRPSAASAQQQWAPGMQAHAARASSGRRIQPGRVWTRRPCCVLRAAAAGGGIPLAPGEADCLRWHGIGIGPSRALRGGCHIAEHDTAAQSRIAPRAAVNGSVQAVAAAPRRKEGPGPCKAADHGHSGLHWSSPPRPWPTEAAAADMSQRRRPPPAHPLNLGYTTEVVPSAITACAAAAGAALVSAW